ncbi:hypothetical protein ACQ5SF_14775, partial [Stenotrophomonas muris]|uniref:hypothetical protein n=1 Tax=Stenotrophomonas muris TaxID=2963283 RepID=UPI003D3384C6
MGLPTHAGQFPAPARRQLKANAKAKSRAMPGSLLFKLFKRNPYGGLLAVSREIVWSGGLALARTCLFYSSDAAADPVRVHTSVSPFLTRTEYNHIHSP